VSALDVNFWDDEAAAFTAVTPGGSLDVNFWDDDALELIANIVPTAVGVNFWDECEPNPADPPVVTVVGPAAGSAITSQTYVVLDVVDDSALFRRIIVTASFPLLDLLDVVHDGDRFGPAYNLRSKREVIANGYRYTLLRNGGWPASPTIVPYAIDRDGNENA
jgi:hypothetical protein